jgi:hypothetical protein
VFYYTKRINLLGLLLLGFSFALILTPFTLSASAAGGYKNPSLIAMLTIGFLLFIAWGVWDGFFASYPIMPRRLFNRTFIACIAIDFFYYFSFYMYGNYFSSWVYVIKDWSDRNYTFFNNILTVGLCGFAIFAGLTQRYFHRFKYQQIAGLAIRTIGTGILYYSSKNPTDAALVCGQVFTSIGGAISVISSQVAAQGSVPHQDLAIAAAILALWTQIGGAVAAAIAASVWNRRMPIAIAQYLGDYYNATGQAEIFGSILIARTAEPRALVIEAYLSGMRPLMLAGFLTSFLGLIAGFFTTNYRLGESHNTVEENKIIRMRAQEEIDPEVLAARAKLVEEQQRAAVIADRRD